jgi:hypothetical protein
MVLIILVIVLALIIDILTSGPNGPAWWPGNDDDGER